MARERKYTQREETANATSHALGIALGITAGYVLLNNPANDIWATATILVYLIGMLSCYLFSTWYHACKDERRKRILQKFDHASIYLHIAGTYTPFTLITLRNEGYWGWGLFLFTWLSAIIGVILSFRRYTKHNHWETICYVMMGSVIFVALTPLLNALSETGKTAAFYWLVAGGASYIIGAIFYSFTKLPYMHTVFHYFVLAGSICHIRAIMMITNA